MASSGERPLETPPAAHGKSADHLIRQSRLLFLLIFLFTPFLIPSNDASASEESWSADFKTTVIAPNGRKILFTGKFYQKGARVRFEPAGAGEVDLYDFERAVGTRLFQEDRIYFESRLTSARLLKAAQEGWIVAPPATPERRILLRDGIVKEKEARLYLVILGEKDRRSYSLRWTTSDEAALPLLVIYPASGYETVIVEYDALRIEPIGPELFDPPADFLNLNPY